MKKLLIFSLLIQTIGYAQKPPKPVENVRLNGSNSTITLYQTKNGVETQAGSVFGLLRDENGNVIIGINPTLTNSLNNFIRSDDAFLYKSHDNTSFANHINLDSVNGTFSAGADHNIWRGSNYSFTVGDGNHQGGEAGFVDGSGNENWVRFGRSGGLISRNGRVGFSNEFSLSDIYGLAMINEGNNNFGRGRQITMRGNDITVFGHGPATVTASGFHIIYGNEKFGVLPNGKIIIGGITYTWPAINQPGVLTNDGLGNLSWQLPSQRPTPGVYKAYTLSGQPLYLVKIE